MCHGELLEGVESATVKHIVYADDGSFIERAQTTFPQTRQTLESKMAKFGHTLWHTPQNQNQPEPVVDALRRMLNKNPGTGAGEVMNIAHKFLDHDDLFCSTRESVLNKPLFYTDPIMSSHPHFLLNPQMLAKDTKSKTPLGDSLVFGCSPPSDNDAIRKEWYEGVLAVGEQKNKRRKVSHEL